MRRILSSVALFCATALLLTACGGGGSGTDGDPGPAGPPGPEGPPGPGPASTIELGEPLPGVNIVVTGVTGGTGPGGNFLPGDTITVLFTLKNDAGEDLDPATMDSGSAYVAGPTFNYQRVLFGTPSYNPRTATFAGSGTWSYTFTAPIPATYMAPYNDSGAFGAGDGELTGQALLDGTYTVGMQFYKNEESENVTYRDAGNATFDFLVGAASAIVPREVVTNDACNACHSELRAHGGSRKDQRLCVLCHTSGSEDRNTDGATPGVSVDYRVMIHQIHNAKHLPSVNGVATNPDGSRNYAAAPKPLEYMGYGNNMIDLSEVGFPVMPSAYVAYLYNTSGDSSPANYLRAEGNGPMPRDVGYGALPPANKLKEDTIRTGVVACDQCHGGAAQGDLYMNQPSRRACGSCHDDVNWANPYVANGAPMPAQPNDDACATCHTPTGGSLPTRESHLHPYSNPAVNTGVNLNVLGVSGGTGVGGRHLLGDPVLSTFNVKNDAGGDIPLTSTARGQAIVIGPTTNPQVLAGNVNLFDSGFRKSSPFTGAGTITGLSIGAGASDRVYAAVFTAANTFDVVTFDRGTSSFATLLAGQVVPAGGSLPVSAGGVSFTVNDTGTDFAAGDRFYMEVIPTAGSYTRFIPYDVSLENLGAVPATLPTTLAVANVPMTWGRQVVIEAALTGVPGAIGGAVPSLGRYVTLDASVMSTLARRDYVVLDYGLATEEFVRIGRIQTTDDTTGADLGAADRFWFATSLRFPHAAGASIQEVTLTNRREGVDYTVPAPNLGQIQLLAGPGAWASTANRVVVNYRTDLRFGRRRYPGDAMQNVVPDAPADTDDIDSTWGDWKGLAFLDGTYTIGFWINRDFTVSGNIPSMPSGEATTYRMINPPSTFDFLYGAGAGSLEPRAAVADGDKCNACHGDVQAHGNGRRGLGTCLMCHSVPGFEDGTRYTIGSGANPDFDAYVASFVPPSPGVTMDFRQLLHKVHMGRELTKGDEYTVVGVFLGIPYPANYAEVGFPAMPGEARQCARCHVGETYFEAAPRSHPGAPAPVRAWRSACFACHDSDAAEAHMDVATPGGVESCAVCHGDGAEMAVEKVHFPR